MRVQEFRGPDPPVEGGIDGEWSGNCGIGDIADGTTNTLMTGERVEAGGQNISNTNFAAVWPGCGNDPFNPACDEADTGWTCYQIETELFGTGFDFPSAEPSHGGLYCLADGSLRIVSSNIE